MSKPIGYGIDFGTTNSLISVAYKDRVDLLAGEGSGSAASEVLPSILYLNREDLEFAGETAVSTYSAAAGAFTKCSDCELAEWDGRDWVSDTCKWVKKSSGCHDARLVTEIKSTLSDDVTGGTHSWGQQWEFADLAAGIMRSLKRRADAKTGVDVRRAVIGHPVAFVGTEGPKFKQLQGLAIERLKAAGAAAGFDEIELLEEPAAAVSAEDEDGVVVALDFGGGTFDVVIIDMQADGGEVLAMHGAAIGGEDFDELLFQDRLGATFGLENGASSSLKNSVSRRSRAVRAMADRQITTELADPSLALLRKVITGGHAYGLFGAIERAKISLSTSDSTRITFDRPGIRVDRPVTRKQFETLIAPKMQTVMSQIDAALKDANVGRSDVALVVRTGGSSSIPMFVQGVEARFGKTKVKQRPPHSSIAMGLGIHARRLWG